MLAIIDALLSNISGMINSTGMMQRINSILDKLIKKHAQYNKHQNGYIVIAKGSILNDPETKNITSSF